MPMYEFRCGSCGTEFEVLVRDGRTPPCPSCASEQVERLLSLFAVSSEQSRQANIASARRAAQRISKEKAVAEQEMVARHAHDDH